jgi:hypothetical protein
MTQLQRFGLESDCAERGTRTVIRSTHGRRTNLVTLLVVRILGFYRDHGKEIRRKRYTWHQRKGWHAEYHSGK